MLYIKAAPVRITTGDGAVVGALAGVVGGAILSLRSYPNRAFVGGCGNGTSVSEIRYAHALVRAPDDNRGQPFRCRVFNRSINGRWTYSGAYFRETERRRGATPTGSRQVEVQVVIPADS
jgi:hypothetical protein